MRELVALTSNANGAQRVAWTPTWAKAREWYRAKLAALPVEQDEAGNIWATLPRRSRFWAWVCQRRRRTGANW